MNKIRTKINDRVESLVDWMEDKLRRLVGEPTPFKRFLFILITGSLLAVANIYFVVSSIYNMGKNEAKKEFLEIRHIETLKLQKDSTKSIKN